jgi:hypothetical protein
VTNNGSGDRGPLPHASPVRPSGSAGVPGGLAGSVSHVSHPQVAEIMQVCKSLVSDLTDISLECQRIIYTSCICSERSRDSATKRWCSISSVGAVDVANDVCFSSDGATVEFSWTRRGSGSCRITYGCFSRSGSSPPDTSKSIPVCRIASRTILQFGRGESSHSTNQSPAFASIQSSP